MDSVNVEDIYRAYEVIDRAGDYDEEVKKSYRTIINGAHGESNCKRLAAQFIPRFFGKFPEFHETAIDALFDLCEDTDLNVRLTVIKYLPNVVRESDKVAVRIADALVQLLQNETAQEIAAVKKALEQVIRLSPRDSIVAIFQQSLKGSPEVRNRTINFLSNDLNRFKEELFEKGEDVEACFANEVKRALHDASISEFEIFMKMLLPLKMYRLENKDNLKELVNVLINSIVTGDEKFDPTDHTKVQKLLLCGKTLIQYFEKGVKSTSFLAFLVNKILPKEIYSRLQERYQKMILRFLAECISGKHNEATIKNAAPLVKELFINEIPPPGDDTEIEPKLDLPRVEYIVFALYCIASKIPEIVEGQEMISRFRNLYAVAIKCISRIKQGLKDLQKRGSKDQETTEKIKKAESGQIVTNNILSMIKELMKPVKARHFTKIVHSWNTSTPNVVVASTLTPVKRAVDADSSSEVPTNKKQMVENLRSQMVQKPNSFQNTKSSRAGQVPSRQQFNKDIPRIASGVVRKNGSNGGSDGRSKIDRNSAQNNQANLYVPPPRRD
ncbi:apoptosis inhibitor 5 [Gigaspora margarita]|uniref:Apoptosis inhibitor 5 n=1 Tax=Gigaspora margarita TaxID=4874 RepID=A0A8H4ESV3_GIGMA|nr:apoptosis inhibitor 5 [Gigaspora margarita]